MDRMVHTLLHDIKSSIISVFSDRFEGWITNWEAGSRQTSLKAVKAGSFQDLSGSSGSVRVHRSRVPCPVFLLLSFPLSLSLQLPLPSLPITIDE